MDDFVVLSHTSLPKKKREFVERRLQFVVAFTPFPRYFWKPQLLSCPYQSAPKCRRCEALATGNYIRVKNRDQWICACCFANNQFWDSSRFADTVQAREFVYDTYVDNGGDKKERIEFRPDRIVFAVEQSRHAMSSGLFKSAMDLVRKTSKKCQCEIAVVAFGKSVKVPKIMSDRKKYGLLEIVDPHVDSFPATETSLFQMPEDMDLLYSYLDFLEKEIVNEGTVVDLTTFMMSMRRLFSGNSTIMIYSCEAAAGNADSLVSLFMNEKMSVNLCILTIGVNQEDMSSLTEFICGTNSKLELIGVSQIPSIVNRVVPVRISEPEIHVSFPEKFLELSDVIGCGIRESNHRFGLSSMTENDTVYFYFDCHNDVVSPNVDIEALTFQFRVKYVDGDNFDICRVVSMSLPLADSFDATIGNPNLDLFIASSFLVAANYGRETGKHDNMFMKHKSIFEAFEKDNVIKRLPSTMTMKVRNAFKQCTPDIVSPLAAARLIGRCPMDVSNFLCPMAYKLQRGSNQLIGPYVLTGYRIANGALFIDVDVHQSVVFIADGEDVNSWLNDLKSPPLSDVIRDICHGRFISVIASDAAADNPLYRFISLHMNS